MDTDLRHRKIILQLVIKKRCNPNIIKLLLEHGAHVNVKDLQFHRPLHCAISAKINEILKILLQYEVNINIKDLHGFTPLHLAVRKLDNLKNVEFLITNSVAINAKKYHLFTPLRLAMENKNQIKVITFLLNHGPGVKTKLLPRNTHTLTKHCYRSKVINFLLKHQAHVNAMNECGETVISTEYTVIILKLQKL